MTDRKELEGMNATLKQAHDALQSEFVTLRSDHAALAESTRVMMTDREKMREPKARLLLGLVAQLSSQFRDFRGQRNPAECVTGIGTNFHGVHGRDGSSSNSMGVAVPRVYLSDTFTG